jgi:hypothetical protein
MPGDTRAVTRVRRRFLDSGLIVISIACSQYDSHALGSVLPKRNVRRFAAVTPSEYQVCREPWPNSSSLVLEGKIRRVSTQINSQVILTHRHAEI